MNIQEFEINIPDNIIDKITARTDGIRCNNIGGVQNHFYHENLDWMESIIQQVRELFPTHKISDGWFNISGKGAYNIWHRHIKNETTAAVYITVPDNSGDLEFQVGREFFRVTPSTGKVICFPSDAMHRVLPNNSDNVRISAVFNLIKV